MLGVYRFYWDCGRQGDLSGVFVANSEDIDKAIGKRIDFGEALGKFSNIYGDLTEEDIELLSDNPEVIQVVQDHGLTNGWNPLEYIQE